MNEKREKNRNLVFFVEWTSGTRDTLCNNPSKYMIYLLNIITAVIQPQHMYDVYEFRSLHNFAEC